MLNFTKRYDVCLFMYDFDIFAIKEATTSQPILGYWVRVIIA